MKRRKAREYALQMLFQLDFNAEKPGEHFFDSFWRPLDEPEQVKAFAQRIVEGTIDHLEEIDAIIRRYAENWVLERMALVDRNVLRGAAYELLYEQDTPAAVVINEALEIAKKFSMKESSAFINGILDKIAKSERKAKS
ncbi:MAG: transcription antitermination factor NusB [Nitrospiraceae bacterium]|nr:transcription antitermination factor NusB [Nitrospiraceae bacterium]